MTSRGIRNNNPGNIDYHKEEGWQGLDNPPSDGRFCRFKTPAMGIRALARTLITYQDNHHTNTVRGIINRWAPPVENNTQAYIYSVAQKIGVSPVDTIDVHTYPVMRALVEAIILHENGSQPYSAAVIDRGLTLAGVPPTTPAKKLMDKLDIVTQAGGPSGVGGATGIDQAQTMLQGTIDNVSVLSYSLEAAKWALLGLGILMFGFSMYRLFAKLNAKKGE